MDQKLVFIGFGNVGRALARLLMRKQNILRDQYGITFITTGISTGRHGFAVDPSGIDLDRALALVESGKSIDSLSQTPIANSLDVIKHSQGTFMFENSPVNHSTGQPAIDHVRAALELGMNVSTANKGTVVHGYRSLTQLAQSQNKKFYFESTVLGGSPLFSIFRETMPAADLISFEGILNSTTNIILSRMERGESFDEAVKYCQSVGIAETDPSADVDGWDAAIKVAALITVLMDAPFTPQQVQREGIRSITSGMIDQAKAEGKRWKLVCSAERAGDQIIANVAPILLESSSPLYNMQDSTSGVAFRTDVLGDYAITESEREGMVAGPIPTAYGLFADFINILR
jgi:homoserine dehydrogenase